MVRVIFRVLSTDFCRRPISLAFAIYRYAPFLSVRFGDRVSGAGRRDLLGRLGPEDPLVLFDRLAKLLLRLLR